MVNGAKTFITGGHLADLVIVLARTSTDSANRRNGLTLLVVEDGMPGFTKGRRLDKIGLKAQDTVELSFNDVRVPTANLLGRPDGAFGYLRRNLVADRCLQLFGGYGYITESPIARIYADARVTRIYGGTSEVMKSIIAKSLGVG
jgi:alkylation response protein AidB-like acyl-CoA dehydrogenase